MKFDTLNFLKKYVAFPSISAESSRVSDVRKCAEFLRCELSSLGFNVDFIETALHPIVFAKRPARVSCGAKVRILCYGHYDVQPVDPVEKWHTPPFEPTIVNGKLMGRGTADNKGPTSCLIAGLADFLSDNPDAPIDVAVILEGEEEMGSGGISNLVKTHPEIFSDYDIVVLSDTTSVDENTIVVTTGLRGVGCIDAIFKGANTDLHSGMMGGMVYNPIQAMGEVCASLHTRDGFVNIDGFYDGLEPLADWEKVQISRTPFNAECVKKQFGISQLYSQKGYTPEEASRVLPALDFVGIGGGYQGDGSKSVIPAECFCKISIRTVPPQSTAKMIALVKNAIQSRCPKGVSVEFTEYDANGDGYFVNPQNPVSADSRKARILREAFCAMEKSVVEVFGKKPLLLREGASIPLMSSFKKHSGLDCLMVGLFMPRDNIHAPNEGFPLDMIELGSKYYKLFFENILK